MIHITLALAVLGSWEVTLPVNGLTDDTAADFKERVLGHFAKIRNDADEPYDLELRTKGDLATIQVNCKGAVRSSDLRAALKGSKFALRPESWFAYGRIALEWETERELSKEQIQKLESSLNGFGSVGKTVVDGTRFAEVVRDGARKGFVYHAHIRFKKRGQGPASKLELIVRASGIKMKNPTLLWERGRHMPWSDSDCGARRK